MSRLKAYTDPAPLALAPAGSALHFRATVTNASQTLEACIGTTLPNYPVPNTSAPDRRIYPKAVLLAKEKAATGDVYFTADGVSTPSTTLGLEVPMLPTFVRIPIPDALRASATQQINLIATVNPTRVQVMFEMGD